MLPFFVLVILAPTAIMAQTRVNSFVGCSTGAPGSGIPGVSTTIGAGSSVACARACVGTSQYSYYRAADSACLCSSTSPPSNFIVNAVSGFTTCANDVYATNRLATTFQFLNCGAVNGANGLGPVSITTSMDQCFNNCRFAEGVFVSPSGTTTSQFQCRCRLPEFSSFSVLQCGPGADKFFFYSHSTPAASAGLTRRRTRLRNMEEEKYCPAGLTACRIHSSQEGYECIDTLSELESCGGCVFGSYGTRRRGAKGVNCVSLETEAGSMTCRAGRCVAAFDGVE